MLHNCRSLMNFGLAIAAFNSNIFILKTRKQSQYASELSRFGAYMIYYTITSRISLIKLPGWLDSDLLSEEVFFRANCRSDANPITRQYIYRRHLLRAVRHRRVDDSQLHGVVLSVDLLAHFIDYRHVLNRLQWANILMCL